MVTSHILNLSPVIEQFGPLQEAGIEEIPLIYVGRAFQGDVYKVNEADLPHTFIISQRLKMIHAARDRDEVVKILNTRGLEVYSWHLPAGALIEEL